MIVYNVGRRFFEMKADAEAFRRSEKLPPSANQKIEICDREQLAAFLNAICEGERSLAAQGVEPMAISGEALEFIPDFMKRDWERRRKFATGSAK